MSKTLLTTLLAATSLVAATPAPEVHRENTAKFELTFQRKTWDNGKKTEGSAGAIKINNLDTVTLKHWVLEFDYNGDINLKETSSGRINITRQGNRYTVRPDTDYLDYQIPTKGTVDFQFTWQGGNDANDNLIENIILESPERPAKVTTIKPWALKSTFAVGEVVAFDGKYYACRQAHTAHAPNWIPVLTPALWAKKSLNFKDMDVVVTDYKN